MRPEMLEKFSLLQPPGEAVFFNNSALNFLTQ